MKKEEQSFGRKMWISFFIILGLLFVGSLIAAILAGDVDDAGANTAIIKIEGVIVGSGDEGLFSGGLASSTEIVDELERARDDPRIEAVILEINSPGGSAVASDEIAQAVKGVRAENKTVVAWVRETGASGAYWVASSSDHIVANRMSITGSIGVISSYMEFDEFLGDWNVSYNRLTAGDQKDIGDPFTELTPERRAFLQAKLDRVHGFFIEEVANNRNMTVRQIEPLAEGQFFLGVEAKDVGLVDELGGKDEAIAWIEARRDITVSTVEYEPEKTFFEALFGVVGKQEEPSVMDYADYLTYARASRLYAETPVPMLR